MKQSPLVRLRDGVIVVGKDGNESEVRPRNVTVEKLLGGGANGVVFLARSLPDQKVVAVKVWGPPRADETRDRLDQGVAELVKTSRYPHTVQVLDAQVTNGCLCVTMEFIDGSTLAAWLKEPAADMASRYCVAWKLLEIETEAITMGLVHGDLHAGNVMLRSDHGSAPIDERVVVIDAGTSIRSGRKESHKRHIRTLYKTIADILRPIDLRTLGGDQLPPGIAFEGKSIRISGEDVETRGKVVDYLRKCLQNLPSALAFLGFPEPDPIMEAFGNFDAMYPQGSTSRLALETLKTAVQAGQVQIQIGTSWRHRRPPGE